MATPAKESVITQTINQFDGPFANDLRSTDATQVGFTKGFDRLAFPHRLVPYRSYEAGNDTLNRKIHSYLYCAGKLFGKGFISGTPTVYDPKVYYKTVFSDGTWSETANNSDATSNTSVPGPLFIKYSYGGADWIYGASDTASIFKYDPTGAAAFVYADTAAAGIGIQGVVHSKDDILYVAGTRKLHKNVQGTWTLNILTLPSNLTISAICEYGNYLAIACNPNDALSGPSRVFLWDRDSSVTTLAESIEWGVGSLNVLQELEGQLIGVSLAKRETSGNLLFKSTLSFRAYDGSQGATEFARIDGSESTGTNPISILGTTQQKINNRIYFTAVITTPEGSVTREGVWSVGRSGAGRPFVVTNEYQSSDGTIPSAIDGFFLLGSYIFISYSTSGSLSGNISKSDDQGNFTNNSTYESLILNAGEASLKKKLIGVTVDFAPLPSGGQVVLKYRIDDNIKNDNSTWNTIFTYTTANGISHSAVNIESTGVTLPEFKEIQFQILSTGGAVPTSFSYDARITGKRPY